MIKSNISTTYSKFFNKFNEITTLAIDQWSDVHIIGYFCQRYKNHYNIDYTFKLTAVPSKSFEKFQLDKIKMMLTKDPTEIKKYIDWVFDTKIISTKRRITSIGYLANEKMITEYKFNFLSSKKIDRSTTLPNNLIHPNITTYGDLAFIYQAYKTNDEIQEQYNDYFDRLKNNNFDFCILEKLK